MKKLILMIFLIVNIVMASEIFEEIFIKDSIIQNNLLYKKVSQSLIQEML